MEVTKVPKKIVTVIEPKRSMTVDKEKYRQMLNASGKEHSAFALRSEVAAFQNDESDDIWDFVSVDEYRKMDDELKKAYQYFEWNDRSGAYRYYEEIQKKVSSQVRDWKAINPRDGISSIRILLFSV